MQANRPVTDIARLVLYLDRFRHRGRGAAASRARFWAPPPDWFGQWRHDTIGRVR